MLHRGTARRKALRGLVLAWAVAAAGAFAATPPVETPAPDTTRSLTGHFLIAPAMQEDGPFGRSVVFVIHHDASGATGVIVNKPIGTRPLPGPPEGGGNGPSSPPVAMLHFGGPVAREALLVLHSPEFAVDDTHRVSSIAALSPPEQVFRALASGRGPERFLVLSGYTGWAPGQLDAELSKGWWHTAPADADLLFDTDYDTKWERVMKHRPGEP